MRQNLRGIPARSSQALRVDAIPGRSAVRRTRKCLRRDPELPGISILPPMRRGRDFVPMPVVRRMDRWDYRPARRERFSAGRHRDANAEAGSTQRKTALPLPEPLPQCSVGTARRKGEGIITWQPGQGISGYGRGGLSPTASWRGAADSSLEPRRPPVPLVLRGSSRAHLGMRVTI